MGNSLTAEELSEWDIGEEQVIKITPSDIMEKLERENKALKCKLELAWTMIAELRDRVSKFSLDGKWIDKEYDGSIAFGIKRAAGAATLHHIYPRCKGTVNRVDNLYPLTKRAHMMLHSDPVGFRKEFGCELYEYLTDYRRLGINENKSKS